MTQRLFLSYSHKDEASLDTFRVHLRPLERAGVVAPWFDRYMLAGDDVDKAIRSALQAANLIALLVSPDFLASDYCYDVEMAEAVARHEEGIARVVPIIVRTCQWQNTPFRRLKATPGDKPISRWFDKDEAWDVVARDIASAANFMESDKPAASAQSATGSQVIEAVAAGVPFRPSRRLDIETRHGASDEDKDDFRHAAFEEIAEIFRTSLTDLQDGFSGRFRRVDADRFTGTIYNRGQRIAGCTIWTGDTHWGGQSICYSNSDQGGPNSINLSLRVDSDGADIFLSEGIECTGGRGGARLDPGAAAHRLWSELTQSLDRRLKLV